MMVKPFKMLVFLLLSCCTSWHAAGQPSLINPQVGTGGKKHCQVFLRLDLVLVTA
jgi:hypothetical protein